MGIGERKAVKMSDNEKIEKMCDKCFKIDYTTKTYEKLWKCLNCDIEKKDYPIIRERKWISKEEAKKMFPDSNECKADLHMLSQKLDDMNDMLVQHTFQLDEIRENMNLAERRKTSLISLEEKVDDNMKRLNNMMLELKGIIAMVRPMAKKNDWYGQEILHREDKIKDEVVVEVKYPELEKMN